MAQFEFPNAARPVLDKLESAGIVMFTLSQDKKVVEVDELCDNHFQTTLNREEMGKLILEFMHIYDSMRITP